MDEVTRFKDLKERLDSLSSTKIRIDERFKTQKKRLEELLKEIQDKGYDPQKLAEIRKEKRDELEKNLNNLEKQIVEIEEKIGAIEG